MPTTSASRTSICSGRYSTCGERPAATDGPSSTTASGDEEHAGEQMSGSMSGSDGAGSPVARQVAPASQMRTAPRTRASRSSRRCRRRSLARRDVAPRPPCGPSGRRSCAFLPVPRPTCGPPPARRPAPRRRLRALPDASGAPTPGRRQPRRAQALLRAQASVYDAVTGQALSRRRRTGPSSRPSASRRARRAPRDEAEELDADDPVAELRRPTENGVAVQCDLRRVRLAALPSCGSTKSCVDRRRHRRRRTTNGGIVGPSGDQPRGRPRLAPSSRSAARTRPSGTTFQ